MCIKRILVAFILIFNFSCQHAESESVKAKYLKGLIIKHSIKARIESESDVSTFNNYLYIVNNKLRIKRTNYHIDSIYHSNGDLYFLFKRQKVFCKINLNTIRYKFPDRFKIRDIKYEIVKDNLAEMNEIQYKIKYIGGLKSAYSRINIDSHNRVYKDLPIVFFKWDIAELMLTIDNENLINTYSQIKGIPINSIGRYYDQKGKLAVTINKNLETYKKATIPTSLFSPPADYDQIQFNTSLFE